MANSNSNCLLGLACPKCGQEDTLRIQGTAVFTVTDDGIYDYENVEWDDDSYAACPQCGFEGKLGEFQVG